ncbi:hypothetical protein [Kistimonas asteriae]|uniref:hypothetical protein n=1 Tax=Kistimonas asteriae TaxID=517724 RepID=UPI001BA5E17F|nr:hypothetical protein [Kistimonas asteriae]
MTAIKPATALGSEPTRGTPIHDSEEHHDNNKNRILSSNQSPASGFHRLSGHDPARQVLITRNRKA